MSIAERAAAQRRGTCALTSEQELRLRSHEELVGLVQKLEREKLTLISDHSAVMHRINEHLQTHLVEIRALREASENAEDNARALKAANDRAAANARDADERLAVETKDLLEICCFIDDERQRLQHLAYEWQRYSQRVAASAFGYNLEDFAAQVHDQERSEIAAVDDNSRLRELCLYLGEGLAVAAAARDMRTAAQGPAAGGNDSLHRGHGDADCPF